MAEPLPLGITAVKRCVMCKQVLPLSEFNVHRRRRDGLQPHCRDCNRRRSRQYYAENREKHLAVVLLRNQRQRAENRSRMLEFLRAGMRRLC